jgi:hypothetical protein
MSGKGDNPRPFSVPEHVFSNNWDSIFGKKSTDGQPLTEPETGKESEILCKTAESDQIQAGRKAHPIS